MSVKKRMLFEVRKKLEMQRGNLRRAVGNVISNRRKYVLELNKVLHLLSPREILSRGYCLAWDSQQRLKLRRLKY